jgi:hypothetical protein
MGEVGVLNYVHCNPKLSGKCYLVRDYGVVPTSD